eukprot:g883.t1
MFMYETRFAIPSKSKNVENAIEKANDQRRSLESYCQIFATITSMFQFVILSAWCFRSLQLFKLHHRTLNEQELEDPLLDGELASSSLTLGKSRRQKKEPKESLFKPLKRLLKLARPEMCILSCGLVGLFGTTGSQMITPLLFSRLTSLVSPAGFCKISDGNASTHANGTCILTPKQLANLNASLNWVGVELAIVFTVSAGFTFIRAYFFTLAGERLVARIRGMLFRAVLQQEVGFFDSQKSGDIANRLASDTTVIADCVTVNVSMGLRWAAQASIALLFLFVLSWKLTLIMLSIIPAVSIAAVLYGKWLKGVSKAYQDALAQAGEIAVEVVSSLRTVRSFSAEQAEVKRYKSSIHRSFTLGAKRAFAYGSFAAGIGALAYMAIVFVLWYGSKLAIWNLQNNKTDGSSTIPGQSTGGGGAGIPSFSGLKSGEMTSGNLFAFLFYTIYISVAVGGLSDLYGKIMTAVGASVRMFEILDRQPAIDNLKGEHPETFTGRVEFQDVSFAYPTRSDVPVLQDLSLVCKPASITALVGSSGAGKSTVVALIERFYDPIKGKIKFDNYDLKKVSPLWIHKNVALVSQEPVLFSCSIAENIAYGISDIGGDSLPLLPGAPENMGSEKHPSILDNVSLMAEIEMAAKKANAHDFIMSFPDGYATNVGERGVQLSGGQKQRIAIARAILCNPTLLLLDEATSALDAESEAKVQQALDKIMVGRTVIVIAHRLSTVRDADCVVVMGNGKIQEMGTHDELLNMSSGIYRKLVERQLTHTSPTIAKDDNSASPDSSASPNNGASPDKK